MQNSGSTLFVIVFIVSVYFLLSVFVVFHCHFLCYPCPLCHCFLCLCLYCFCFGCCCLVYCWLLVIAFIVNVFAVLVYVVVLTYQDDIEI